MCKWLLVALHIKQTDYFYFLYYYIIKQRIFGGFFNLTPADIQQ